MNTIQRQLFFMALAAFSTLVLAQNAPRLAMQETTVVKQNIGKLAVIRPNLPKSIDENDVFSFWSTLENLAAQQKTCTVILRNDKDLGGLIKEIGFQGTHLVDSNGKKILPNKIKAVDTLLCSSIGQFGNAWTLRLAVVNAQSASISTEYSSLETFNSLEDIIHSLEAQVQILFKRMEIKDAMLVDLVCADGIRLNGQDFLNALEKEIFDKVSLSGTRNLKALFEEMHKNGRDSMLSRDWPRFRRIAAVRYLVEPKITCWRLTEEELGNSYNHEKRGICRLEAECMIQVVDTRDGSLKAAIHLAENVNNREYDMTVQDFKANCQNKVFKEWVLEAAGKLTNAISELKAAGEN